MKNWRTEYKIILFIGILFLIILVLYLVRTDFVEKVKLDQKKKDLVDCTTQTQTKGIEYTDYTCTLKDDNGNSYTISYLQIESNESSIKKLNNLLKSNFDKAYNSVEYNLEDNLAQLGSYQKINYKIYTSRNITSLLIQTDDIQHDEEKHELEYSVYNIDNTTYEILNATEMKEKLQLDRNFAGRVRSKAIEMYVLNFYYDYDNELEIYRNKLIDDSIENITYNKVSNIYVDDNYINYIVRLFNPDIADYSYYRFRQDEKENITYEILEY